MLKEYIELYLLDIFFKYSQLYTGTNAFKQNMLAYYNITTTTPD